MNNTNETIPLNGFRVCKEDYEEVKNVFENAKYVYLAKDGRHIRPYLAFENIDTKVGNQEHGIVLGITAFGLTVKGTYSSTIPPDMNTITTNWKEFLIDWVKQQNEHWVLIDETN